MIRLVILAFGMVLGWPAAGQTPTVISVENALTGSPKLSPGARVRLRHTIPGFDSASTEVRVNGRAAAIIAYAGDVLGVVLPMDLSPGPAGLVVSARGVSTPPFPITIDSHAPAILPASYCPVLGAQGMTLTAFGLGATDPLVPAGATFERPAPTTAKPSLTIGGRSAEVVSSTLAPTRSEGIYHVEFRLPPDTPDGDHEVVLTIEGHSSSPTQLRVSSATTGPAASFADGRGAPGSIMSAYGCASTLASNEMTGDPRNPPPSLAGTTVTIKDSAGTEHVAPLYYAAPRQVNYLIPSNVALGPASVTILPASGSVSTAALQIEATHPTLFTAPPNYASALVVRTREGVQTIEPVVQIVGGDDGQVKPLPIDLGPSSDDVVLVLFGTGLGRHQNVTVFLGEGGPELAVEYAGPQGEYPGLDQINARVPKPLPRPISDFQYLYVRVDGKWVQNDSGLVFK